MSPFVSKAQKGWMFANKPEMAEKWAAKTPKGKKLPEHVAKKSKVKKSKPQSKLTLKKA